MERDDEAGDSVAQPPSQDDTTSGDLDQEQFYWDEANRSSSKLEKKLVNSANKGMDDEDDASDNGLIQEDGGEYGDNLREDVSDLTQLLMNELSSPDLQPFRLFENLKQRAREQVENALDDARADALEKQIFEMDSNRIEFELVSLNRTRMQKIAKFARFFMTHQLERMSNEEIDFAQAYLTLRKDHMDETFLRHLPPTFEDMDSQDEVDIYAKPNLRTFVIFRALKDLGQVIPGEMRYVMTNETFACPYSLVMERLLAGDVELL